MALQAPSALLVGRATAVKDVEGLKKNSVQFSGFKVYRVYLNPNSM